MSKINRRDLFKTLLGGALSAAGTVVLARAALAGEKPAETPKTPEGADVQERADRLAGQPSQPGEGGAEEPVSFLNTVFRNGGGFRNGGFFNGGGFRNGGFGNGGFGNGGFRNGGFFNGGFRNW